MFDIDKKISTEGLESIGRYYSIYPGTVADVKDPEKRGRIKVKVPMLWDDQTHDEWALPFGMMNSGGVGDFQIPAVGDDVWVQFTTGDQRFPVWSYGMPKTTADTIPAIYDNNGNPVGRVIQVGSNRITITPTNILIGDINVTEYAVLGNTLVATLKDVIDEITKIQVTTSTGLSGFPTNAPALSALKLTFSDILCSITKIK